MMATLFKAARAIWTILALAVLAVTLYGFDGKPNSDIDIVLMWSMLTLAFPMSLLVALIFTGVSILSESVFSTVIPVSYASIAITWLCFFVAGYWQWFVLLPWLWRKWKARGSAGTAASAR
jgi:hypothetical protein